ncbi:hypothetical protein GCM10010420_56210 [Streptomyces glaucosporus]|uniref:Uncharacterized protein n=1 Tax=Streptomyces glaucosporus TaxID=284044 RepID=A0ABN3IZM4_9ACTN
MAAEPAHDTTVMGRSLTDGFRTAAAAGDDTDFARYAKRRPTRSSPWSPPACRNTRREPDGEPEADARPGAGRGLHRADFNGAEWAVANRQHVATCCRPLTAAVV